MGRKEGVLWERCQLGAIIFVLKRQRHDPGLPPAWDWYGAKDDSARGRGRGARGGHLCMAILTIAAVAIDGAVQHQSGVALGLTQSDAIASIPN